MAVPEAPVHEDDLAPFSEYKVRSARQLLIVEAVSITEMVHQSAHCELGFESLLLMRRMFSLRAAFVSRSISFSSVPPIVRNDDDSRGSLGEFFVGLDVVSDAEKCSFDVFRECLCEEGWDGVPHLLVLANSASVESVLIGERLEPRCFSHGESPVLVVVEERAPVRVALGEDCATESLRVEATVPFCVVASPRALHSSGEESMGDVAPAPSRRDVPEPSQVFIAEIASHMIRQYSAVFAHRSLVGCARR